MTVPKALFFLILLGILVGFAAFQNLPFSIFVKTAVLNATVPLYPIRDTLDIHLDRLFGKNRPVQSQMDFPALPQLKGLHQTVDSMFKTEFEDLLSSVENLQKLKIGGLYPIVFLLRTMGTGNQETWMLYTEEAVPGNAFVVSIREGVLIGRVHEVNGNILTVIPLWNQAFSTQVRVLSGDQQTRDLAYLEDGKLLNFNPSFPFQPGDEVYLSDYEPGGYALQRYGWNLLGTVGALLNEDIVEYYEIRYLFQRERFQDERYFLIVS
ncbi:MAG: hypothetical protein KBC39_06445 [Thermotogae bacterium]|nr:hypothetical protein [Thermotogota bacterium]